MESQAKGATSESLWGLVPLHVLQSGRAVSQSSCHVNTRESYPIDHTKRDKSRMVNPAPERGRMRDYFLCRRKRSAEWHASWWNVEFITPSQATATQDWRRSCRLCQLKYSINALIATWGINGWPTLTEKDVKDVRWVCMESQTSW